MARLARVAAQAKINLFLRVLARETSGYHSIETVFLRVDLADQVTVRETRGRTIDCVGPSIPDGGLGPAQRNLAYRAAAAYADATGWPSGFALEITKNIPVGGGLGGGSADAGATLRALDALSPRPLGPRLIELATPLGADVPFMTLGNPMAFGWGRGERLMPLRALDSRSVVLLVPGFPVSTADAYAWVAGDRGAYTPTGEVITPESLASWEGVRRHAGNDFEGPVSAREPTIRQLIDELAASDAAIAMLSGSGSTVFGIFAGEPRHQPESRGDGVTPIHTRTSTRVEAVQLEG